MENLRVPLAPNRGRPSRARVVEGRAGLYGAPERPALPRRPSPPQRPAPRGAAAAAAAARVLKTAPLVVPPRGRSMQLANVAPNLITYNALIHACATVGATDAAFQVCCALDPLDTTPPRPYSAPCGHVPPSLLDPLCRPLACL